MKVLAVARRNTYVYILAERQTSYVSSDEWTTSMCSLTTNSTATTDDLPGTGRVLDMHFYQPVGRKLESWMAQMNLKWSSSRNIAGTVLGLWGMTRPLLDYPTIKSDIESFDKFALESYISEGNGKVQSKIRNLLSKLVAQVCTSNAYRRLIAFTHIFHLATEDACINAYLHKVTQSQTFLNKLKGSAEQNLLDIYASALNELGLEVTQGTCKNVNYAHFPLRLTKILISTIHEYRAGELSPFLAIIRILLLLAKAICWLSTALCEGYSDMHGRCALLNILRAVYHLSSAACCLLLLSDHYTENNSDIIDFHMTLHRSLINCCDTLMSKLISNICLWAAKCSSYPGFLEESIQILILLHGLEVSCILPNAAFEAEVIASELLFPMTEMGSVEESRHTINRLWKEGVNRARMFTGSLSKIQVDAEMTREALEYPESRPMLMPYQESIVSCAQSYGQSDNSQTSHLQDSQPDMLARESDNHDGTASKWNRCSQYPDSPLVGRPFMISRLSMQKSLQKNDLREDVAGPPSLSEGMKSSGGNCKCHCHPNSGSTGQERHGRTSDVICIHSLDPLISKSTSESSVLWNNVSMNEEE